MLEIRLFGTGQALYDSQELPGFPRQQSYLLLCYLLLNRRHPHHRERLASVFWEDAATHVSRKYLRNGLWRLRQNLESAGLPADEYLSISDDSVSWIGASRYWLDVESFETTVALTQELPVESLTPAQVTTLEKALDLYAGDLLEGVYDDWCLYDRERLRLLYLNALGRLVTYHELHDAPAPGLAYCERILAHDRTRERVHRQMMRLYWRAGHRHAALAQYKRCAQILLEELGIPPMRETTLLYRQMSSNRFNPAEWPTSREPAPLDPSLPHDSVEPLAEHALQKLQQLQAKLDETSSELKQIEQLLSLALANSRQT